VRHAAVAFALAFVACTPLPSAAQETARVEVFGGYAFARDDDRNMHGWNGTVTLSLREWLGISADVSGQYASLGATDRARFALLAGPRVSPWRGRFTPFAYALAGAFHTRSRLEFLSVSVSEGETDPGAALGGGVDVRVSARWAAEVKADAALIRSSGRTESTPRLFGGLLLRFGRLQ
jgi:hypothetical protein